MKPEFDATRSVPDAARSTAGLDTADRTHTAAPSPDAPGGSGDPDLIGNRYRLVVELARGGMGVVWKARDESFGRDVAIKFLIERLRSSSEAARRFMAESRITGRLQHPAIPASHEIGKLADNSPFLVMKLIEGETLAHLIESRDEVGRLLGIFEAVCQAVAFAHSRGVIHRDLKPSNVMVGAFGETQVMDWGVAKVIGETEDPLLPGFGEDHAETRTGCVLGTPAFMPPEQARGEIDSIDRRSDVFGLGGILCSILTGEAPYVATTAKLALGMAIDAKLDEAHERLRLCGADPALAALALRCLAAKPDDRPADASEVATAIAKLRNDAEVRAREAEMARARLEVQTAEARKRRKVQFALAATVLLAVVATAIGLWDRQQKNALANQERRDRSIRAEQTLLGGMNRVEGLLQDADGEKDDFRRRRLSVNAAKSELSRVEALLDAEVPEESRSRYRDLQSRWEESNRYADLHQKLVEMRYELNGKVDSPRSETDVLVKESSRLLREFGFDPTSENPRIVAERVKVHPLRDAIVAVWGEWRNYLERDDCEPLRVATAVVLLDGTDFRQQWHDFIVKGRELELRKIADDPRGLELSAQAGIGLARDLQDFGSATEARVYLKKLQVRHAGDYWINLRLSSMAFFAQPRDDVEAINYAMAALGARPDSASAMSNIAAVYSLRQEYATAVVWAKRAYEAAPKNVRMIEKYAGALWMSGDNRRAREMYETALSLARLDEPTLLNFALYSANAGDIANSLDIILRFHAQRPIAADFERHIQYIGPRLGRILPDRITKLESLRKENPNSLGLKYLHARLLVEAGKPEAALEILDQLSPPEPPGPFLIVRGQAHAKMPGGRAKAREFLNQAIVVSRHDSNATREFGLFLADEPGMRKEAIALLEIAIEQEYHGEQAKRALLRLYLIEGKTAESLKIYRSWDQETQRQMFDAMVVELKKAREYDAALMLVETELQASTPPAKLWDLSRQLRTARGDLPAARDAAVKYRDLIQDDPKIPEQYRREAREIVPRLERAIPVDRQLQRHIAGLVSPADAATCFTWANHCYYVRYHFKRATELYEAGFGLNPAMLDPTAFVSDRSRCIESIMWWLADLAADAPAPADPGERRRLRDLALKLMTIEIQYYENRLPTAKKPFNTVLAYWAGKDHFAHVRGDAIDKLPAEERESWRKLWAEHRRVNDALLSKPAP